MTTKTKISFRAFQGLNTNSDPTEIEDQELSECVNFNLTLRGSLESRTGLEKKLTESAPCRLAGKFVIAGTEYGVYYDGTNVKAFTGVTTTGIIIDDNVADVIDATTGLQYVDKFYLFGNLTGVGWGIFDWNGSVMNHTNLSLRLDKGLIHKERLFAIGSAPGLPNRSRLYFSDPGDPLTINSTKFIDFDPGDGYVLTDLVVLYDTIFVFKQNSVYTLSVQGSSEADWVVRKVESSLGCSAVNCAKVWNNQIFFISQQGLYRTDGTVFREVSVPIRNQFENRTINNEIDEDYLVIHQDQLVCSVLRPGNDRRYYIYHLNVGGWTEWTFAENCNGLYATNEGGLGTRIYFAGDDGIYEYGDVIWTDDSGDYTCSFATKSLNFESPLDLKRGFWVGLDAFVTVTSSFQNDIDGTAYTSPVVSDTDRRAFKIPGPGYFRHWLGRFSTTGQCEVYSLTLVVGLKNKIHGHLA